MMSRTKKRGAAAYIPTDLHEEILSWLPSNDLLKLKIVCKEWNRLISSPDFIQKHLERTKAECNGTRILTLNNTDLEMIDMEKNIAKRIDMWRNVKSFLGSCDGLALCRLSNGKIAAVNPSTGKYVVRKPKPSIRYYIKNTKDYLWLICSWFGHHPATGEYVLVLAHLWKSIITFRVYTLSHNIKNPLLSSSTHHLINQECCSLGKIGTFLHGRLHCPVAVISFVGGAAAFYEVFILVHSFQTNGNIERMCCPAKSCATLGVVNGCLSIICKGPEAYEVWMMKEYGVMESWTKFANIEGYTMNGNGFLSMFIPLDFFPNGCVILKGDGSGITKYSFGNSEAKITMYRYEGIVCIDSLVSPRSLVFRKKEAIVE